MGQWPDLADARLLPCLIAPAVAGGAVLGEGCKHPRAGKTRAELRSTEAN